MKKRRIIDRLIVFVLAAAMMVSSQSFMALADTVAIISNPKPGIEMINGDTPLEISGDSLGTPEEEWDSVSSEENSGDITVTFYKADPGVNGTDENNKIGTITVIKAEPAPVSDETADGGEGTGTSGNAESAGEGSSSPAAELGKTFGQVRTEFEAAYPGYEGLTWIYNGTDGIKPVEENKLIGAAEGGWAKSLNVWVQPSTVTFWAEEPEDETTAVPIMKFGSVDYGTVLSELIEQVVEMDPEDEYTEETAWNLGSGYVVTGNTNVWVAANGTNVLEVIAQGEKPQYYTNCFTALFKNNGKKNLTIKLLTDATANQTIGFDFMARGAVWGTDCTFDLQGHTLISTYSGSVITVMGSSGSPVTVTIKNGTISANGGNKKIISVDGATLKAENLTITNAVGSSGQGLSLTNGSKAILKDCVISDIENTNNNGAGVNITKGSALFMTGGAIRNNKAKGVNYGGGGAIYLDSEYDASTESIPDPSKAVLTGVEIDGNSTQRYGGAICAQESAVTITGGRISNNNAGMNGGAIYADTNFNGVHEAVINLTNVSVSGNTAQNGGGICAEGCTVNLSGCTVEENRANNPGNNDRDGGGAIYIGTTMGWSSLSVTGGSIKNNSEAAGGTYSGSAISIYNSGAFATSPPMDVPVSIQGVEISGNNGKNALGFYNIKGATLENCYIHENTSSRGTILLYKLDLAVHNCRIEGNTAGDGGGIDGVQGTITLKDTLITGNVVTNKALHAKGGAMYLQTCDLDADASNQIYDNGVVAGEANGAGGDLFFENTSGATSIKLASASDMSKNQYGIWKVNYRWGEDTANIEEQISDDLDISLNGSLALVAANSYAVAGLIDSKGNPVDLGNGSMSFTKVQDAIDYLVRNKVADCTIQLIPNDNGNVITEGVVTIPAEAGTVKLDMNGCTLRLGNQLKIEKGAGLTVTDTKPGKEMSAILSTKKDYAVENAGTLTVEKPISLSVMNTVASGGAATIALDPNEDNASDGSQLIIDAGTDLNRVSLARGNVIQVTGDNGTNLNPIEVKVEEDILADVNVGKSAVTLFRSSSGALTEEFRSRVSLSGANRQVKISRKEDGTKIYADSPELIGIYVDGKNGVDGQDRGLTPEAPLKTFKAAKQLLKEIQESESPLSEANIYVMGTLLVNGAEEWSLSEIQGASLVRYPSYDGILVQVTGGTLSLKDITVDGYSFPTDDTLIWVDGNAELEINDGTVLQNNQNILTGGNYTHSGGAVYSNGKVVMNGGTIRGNQACYGGGIELWGSGAELTMNGGTIESNRAVATNESPAGGGVAVLYDSTMYMNGGSITGNDSSYNGGGIAVGAPGENTVGTSTCLYMKGGTVSNNNAGQTGGGIFVQSSTQAHIASGTISGNYCKGNAMGSGAYGGGGIYVNGSRTGSNGVYKMGELYLEKAVLSGNTAVLGGQGFAGCGTSETRIYLTSGCAIVDNGSSNADQVLVASEGKTYISKFLLGGYAYNWMDEEGKPFDVKLIEYNTGGERRLGNNPESGYPTKASVMITGNSSGVRGGGIGSNGYVQFGEEGPRVTVDFEKELLGREWKNGDKFEFELKRVSKDGEPVAADDEDTWTVTADKDHRTFSIKTGEFKKAGIYVYELRELDTDTHIPTVEKDPTVFEITVKVVEDEVVGLGAYIVDVTAKGSSEPVSQVKFSNHYRAKGTASLEAEKILPEVDLTEGRFTFELKDEAGNVLQTAENAADGKVSFEALQYTEEDIGKEYLYTVSEVNSNGGGVEYDNTVYTVKVNVKDSEASDGSLDITVTKQLGDKTVDEMTFTNHYHAVGQTTVTAEKTLTGHDLAADQFSFTLTAVNADGKALTGDAAYTETVTNAADGKVEFKALDYTEADAGKTYYYQVTETDAGAAGYTYDDSVYIVAVNVTDNGDGTMSTSQVITKDGTAADAITFANTYAAEGSLALEAQKTLSGHDLAAGQFSFTLTAVDADGKALTGAAAYTETVTNAADGKVTFKAIGYTEADAGRTYYYQVTETNAGEEGYTYDASVYTVAVTVTDNGDGTVGTSQAITKDGTAADAITFENTYTDTYAAKGSLAIEAQKTLAGHALAAGQFSFTLTAVDADGKALTGDAAYTDTAANAADGKVSFKAIDYTEADAGKTYYYQVAETNAGAAGYTYDSSVYTVAVAVSDNGDGTLGLARTVTKNGAAADAITFANTYAAAGQAVVTARKTLAGGTLAAGQFSFTLTATDAAGNALTGAAAYTETVANAADGSVVFTPFRFTQADAGSEFHYTVAEAAGTAADITYDTTAYAVTITVADNGDGTLAVTQTIQNRATGTAVQEMAFTNTYTPAPAAAAVQVTKQLTYEGEPLNTAGATFHVALYSDAACTQRVSDITPLVYENASSQTVQFTGLEAGRTYYVAETTAEGAVLQPGVEAEGQGFTPVFPQGSQVTVPEQGGVAVLAFENQYTTLPDGFYRQGDLYVTKQLLGADGAQLSADETFYAGFFADSDYTQPFTVVSNETEVTMVPLKLEGSSTTTVQVGVPFPADDSPVRLYVTEVDPQGNPVEGSSSFAYDVTVEGFEVTMNTEHPEAVVTITNTEQEGETETEFETEVESEYIEEESGTPDAGAPDVVPADTTSVKTGDETPLALYIGLLAAAAALIALLLVFRRRKRG